MSKQLRALVSGGVFACAIVLVPAISGAAFNNNSCLSGFVEAHDYAELETNLAEIVLGSPGTARSRLGIS